MIRAGHFDAILELGRLKCRLKQNLQIDWVLRRLFHIKQSDQGPNCLSETRRVDSNHELNEKCFMYTLWRSITLNSSLTIV